MIRQYRDGWRRFWARNNPWVFGLAAFLVLLFVGFASTTGAGLYVATTGRVSNQAWIAIGTAAYATFTFLTVVVLAIAGSYAALQVNYVRTQVEDAQRRTRLDVLDRLSAQWESDLLREARRLANEPGGKRLQTTLEVYDLRNAKELYTLAALANFFEEMGLLVSEGHLDVGDVTNRFRKTTVYYGYLFSDYIESGREQNEDHLNNFRELAAAMAFASMTRIST